MIPASVERWRSTLVQIVKDPLIVNEPLSILWCESSGNPEATNPHDPSYGLGGLTMLIARAFGGGTDVQPIDLLDPDINLTILCNWLRYLKIKYSERFPNYRWIIAQNAGEGNLMKGFQDEDYYTAFMSHLKELDASDSVT